MKAPALLALALSGCCLFNPTFKKPPEPGDTVEAAPPAGDRFPYGDLSNAKAGEWVKYREAEGREWTLKVLSVKELVTIEISGEKDPIQQRIRLPDRVVASYLWKGRVLAQPIEQSASHETRGGEVPAVGASQTTAAGRTISTVTLKRSSVDSEGIIHEELFEFSAQVPAIFTRVDDAPIDARARGGLVRMKAAGREIELVDFGTDARGSFEIPE